MARQISSIVEKWGKNMKRLLSWFNNHTLRFKIVNSLLILVLLLQFINGIIFYSIFVDKSEKNIIESNIATVNQMATNINRILKDIVTGMTPVKMEVTSYQYINEGSENNYEYAAKSVVYQELFDQLISYGENYQYINSMFILSSNGRNYYYTLYEYMKMNGDPLFQKIIEEHQFTEQCYWGPIVDETYFFTRGDKRLISIIMPVYRYKQIKNLLIVNLDAAELEKYLKSMSGKKNADNQIVVQVRDDGLLSYDGNYEKIAAEDELQELFSRKERSESEIGTKYSVITKKLNINNWKLSMITPLTSIRSITKDMSQFVSIIFISTGIVMLTGVSFIIFTITKPIQKMTEIMEANRHSRSMKYRFYAKYNDEVGVLANTYNQLMDEITELMEEINKEQIQNRKNYFNMLQLQIKPHFLYNTLEAVKFLIEMNDPKSVEMITIIGKFYKLSLNGINDKVKVKEEIDQLTCYLQILKMRYSSKYTYEIAVPDEVMNNEIIKFTLQPLVENAIYHGIKQQRKKGIIKVTGVEEEDGIVITVWDNGAGIAPEKLKEIKAQFAASKRIEVKDHIGIINVHQRLLVQYGEGYGLEIESVQGEYTEVRVKLPYLREAG